MQRLHGMRNTPLWPSLLGPLWPGMVAPDWIISMGQMELVWYLNWGQKYYLCKSEFFEIELFDHLTECKQMTDF